MLRDGEKPTLIAAVREDVTFGRAERKRAVSEGSERVTLNVYTPSFVLLRCSVVATPAASVYATDCAPDGAILLPTLLPAPAPYALLASTSPALNVGASVMLLYA